MISIIYGALAVGVAMVLAFVGLILVQRLVDEEWALMEQGRAAPRAWELLDEIRGSIGRSNPTTEVELGLYYQELDRVEDLADARRLRLVEAEEGIPGILWALVVFGGVVTVGFTYLFGLESTRTHKLMVMALAGVIGLVIFAIGVLDYPFSGSAPIGPTAFELILERFETSELSTLR